MGIDKINSSYNSINSQTYLVSSNDNNGLNANRAAFSGLLKKVEKNKDGENSNNLKVPTYDTTLPVTEVQNILNEGQREAYEHSLGRHAIKAYNHASRRED
jgi:hypothetical protein